MLARVSQDAVTLLDINNSVPARLWEDRIRGRCDYQLTDTFMGFPCGNTPSCKMCADQRHLSHDPQRNDVGRHGDRIVRPTSHIFEFLVPVFRHDRPAVGLVDHKTIISIPFRTQLLFQILL